MNPNEFKITVWRVLYNNAFNIIPYIPTESPVLTVNSVKANQPESWHINNVIFPEPRHCDWCMTPCVNIIIGRNAQIFRYVKLRNESSNSLYRPLPLYISLHLSSSQESGPISTYIIYLQLTSSTKIFSWDVPGNFAYCNFFISKCTFIVLVHIMCDFVYTFHCNRNVFRNVSQYLTHKTVHFASRTPKIAWIIGVGTEQARIL